MTESDTANLTAPLAQLQTAEGNLLLRWIIRLRWPIFVLVGLIHLAAFNGQWRVGRDGSLFRAVGHSLATGHGYSFRGQRENHIYPGLPMLLAGVEKVFGQEDALRPRVSLAIMTAMGLATLVMVYHLVRLYFPLWMAVCVTTGVGVNPLFLHYSHDLMSDLPFLMGSCAFLLGIGKMESHSANRKSQIAKWGLLLYAMLAIVGAIVALSMRPTFWALALAWLGACVLGMVRPGMRKWHGAQLAGVLVLAAAWLVLDPRTKGISPLAGKYEKIALVRLSELATENWFEKLHVTFDEHFPDAMLGFEMPPILGVAFAAVVLYWSIRLLRVAPLWGLYVAATVLMMFLVGSTSRYFLMIVPLVLVAWAVAVKRAADWARGWRYGPEWVMLLGLGMATAPNLVRCVDFVMEQHGIERDGTRKTFLEVYRDGKMLPVYRMAELVRRNVPEGQKVLGPEPRILSFLSGRTVFDPSELVDARQPLLWPGAMAKYRPRFAVYGERFTKENLVGKMIYRGLLVVDSSNAVELDGMWLAPVKVTGNIMRPRGRATTEPGEIGQ